MNHSPSDILAQALSTLTGISPGVASTEDWALFVNQMPVRPLNCIGVYDTSGNTQGRIQQTGQVVEFPGFTILVRATLYDVGWRKANAVKEALDEIRNLLVTIPEGESYTLCSVMRGTPVIATGRDPKDEYDQFSINGTVTV